MRAIKWSSHFVCVSLYSCTLLHVLHLEYKLQPHGKEPGRKEAEEEVDDDSSTSSSASRNSWRNSTLWLQSLRWWYSRGTCAFVCPLDRLGCHGNRHHCNHSDGGVIAVHTPVHVRLFHTQLLHIEQDYKNNPWLVYFHLSYRLTLLFMFWLMRILWMMMGCMQSSSCSFKITTFFKPYLAWMYNFTHDSLGNGKKRIILYHEKLLFFSTKLSDFGAEANWPMN